MAANMPGRLAPVKCRLVIGAIPSRHFSRTPSAAMIGSGRRAGSAGDETPGETEMHANRTREAFITAACYGVSGLALAVGMWIAGSPTGNATALQPAATVLAAACAFGDVCADGTVTEAR